MSWDRQVPDLTQELLRQKIQECITESLETNNQALVTDLGEIDSTILSYWAGKIAKISFKILRHAKAASLVMDHSNVDKHHIDIAIQQLVKDPQDLINNMLLDRI